MSKPFDVEIDNSIAHIRFNRPEKRNSMNEDFWNLFPKEVEELDDSGEIRALIVSSTGPHFSSGIDLNMFNEVNNVQNEDLIMTGEIQYEGPWNVEWNQPTYHKRFMTIGLKDDGQD